MQRPEIVWPVSELTKRVNPLVIVKRNGKLGIGVDPKHLNQSIKCQHYKFPTVERFFSKKVNTKHQERRFLQIQRKSVQSKTCFSPDLSKI